MRGRVRFPVTGLMVLCVVACIGWATASSAGCALLRELAYHFDANQRPPVGRVVHE